MTSRLGEAAFDCLHWVESSRLANDGQARRRPQHLDGGTLEVSTLHLGDPLKLLFDTPD